MKLLSIFVGLLLCSCSVERAGRLNAAPVAPIPVPAATSPRSDTTGSKEAKALWARHRLVDYDMTISLETSSFLEPARKVDVKIRNGTAVSLDVTDTTDKRGRLAFYDPYKTVESMFGRIESLRQRSGSVTVKFNKSYGYPEEIDYSEPNPDSSFTFRVVTFQPRAKD